MQSAIAVTGQEKQPFSYYVMLAGSGNGSVLHGVFNYPSHYIMHAHICAHARVLCAHATFKLSRDQNMAMFPAVFTVECPYCLLPKEMRVR